jgi:hypothetical protein
MFLQAKNGGSAIVAMIGPDAFKDTQTIVQGMGHEVNLGLVPGNELAIQPDEFCLFHHLSVLHQVPCSIFYRFARCLSNAFPAVFIASGPLFPV